LQTIKQMRSDLEQFRGRLASVARMKDNSFYTVVCILSHGRM
jgi:hypothetical protein